MAEFCLKKWQISLRFGKLEFWSLILRRKTTFFFQKLSTNIKSSANLIFSDKNSVDRSGTSSKIIKIKNSVFHDETQNFSKTPCIFAGEVQQEKIDLNVGWKIYGKLREFLLELFSLIFQMENDKPASVPKWCSKMKPDVDNSLLYARRKTFLTCKVFAVAGRGTVHHDHLGHDVVRFATGGRLGRPRCCTLGQLSRRVSPLLGRQRQRRWGSKLIFLGDNCGKRFLQACRFAHGTIAGEYIFR